MRGCTCHVWRVVNVDGEHAENLVFHVSEKKKQIINVLLSYKNSV